MALILLFSCLWFTLNAFYLNLQAIKYGGQKEFDLVKSVWNNPPTPSAKVSALYVYEPKVQSQFQKY